MGSSGALHFYVSKNLKIGIAKHMRKHMRKQYPNFDFLILEMQAPLLSSHLETSRYDRCICAILSRAVLILLYVQWWSALLTLWSEHRNYSGILLTLYQLNNTIWFLIRHYSYLTQ